MFGLFTRSKSLKDPNFIIVGAQKSGTTALHYYLSQHPWLQSSVEKELHFFSSDKLYSKGMDFYYSKFLNKDQDVLSFEASPSYLMHKEAYKRIYKYNRKIKLIVILRDPVERAYSAWNMYRTRYLENRNWFFDGWLKLIGGSPELYIKRTDKEVVCFYDFISAEIHYLQSDAEKMLEAPILPQGFYKQHLDRFFSLFSKDQILVIENSSFRKNRVAELKRIESFLCVKEYDWNEVSLEPVFEGKYTSEIDSESLLRLVGFYKQHNEALFNLVGERYDWSNT